MPKLDNKDNKDDKEPAGKTRATQIPLSLDTRISKFVNAYYSSYSEFLREGARRLCIELENQSIQGTVWEMVGGPITEGVIKMVDSRVSQVEDHIHEIDKMVGGLMEEKKINLPDGKEEDDDWEED